MRAVVWNGRRDVRVEEVADPVIQDPGDAIIKVTSTNICGSDLHLYEPLGAFMHAGRHHRARADGRRRGGRGRRHRDRAGRPGRHPVPGLLRHLLDVRARPAEPVRDHPGTRTGHRRSLVRVLRALRLGSRRTGRVPPRPAGAVHPHQGSRRAARRAVRLPVRRAPHGLAGRRVRRPGARRHPARARPRPDRRHGLPHRPAPRGAPGDRRRPRRRPARSGPATRGVTTVDLRDVDDVAAAVRDLTDGRGRGCRRRRGRDGGARVTDREGEPQAGRARCPTPWPRS